MWQTASHSQHTLLLQVRSQCPHTSKEARLLRKAVGPGEINLQEACLQETQWLRHNLCRSLLRLFHC
jgi:hypothetical protein